MYKGFVKRAFDLSFAFIALVILSPVIILITVILTITNKGKPFFAQYRPGKGGVTFKILKFKSMTDLSDKNGNSLPDNIRLTPIGCFLRKTSLDELTQLINVIKGEMSLIGPRPLLIRYLPYYTEEESLRHSVRPGITGWAQVNGRNFLTWDKRMEADIYYVKNMSFKLDMQILFKTIKNVFLAKDIIYDQTDCMDFDTFRRAEIASQQRDNKISVQ